jgi:hypothetical protein
MDLVDVARRERNQEMKKLFIDIELEGVQQGVAGAGKPFLINVTGSARKRLLVQPLSNLMASGQQHLDRIRVTHNGESGALTFFRETDAWEIWTTNRAAAA